MRFSIAISILLLAAGCVPSTDNSSNPSNTNIDPQFKNNISTLFGAGGKVTKDSHGQELATDIVWKDSAGNLQHLDSLRGKIVVLNFWATSCTYCVREMPDLQSIYDSLSSEGVIVLGVSVNKGNTIFSDVKFYVDNLSITYQIIIDPPAKTYFNYGASSSLPWTYIIDQNGFIRFIFPGEPTKNDFLDAIGKLM